MSSSEKLQEGGFQSHFRQWSLAAMFVSAHKWWWKWFRPCLIKDSSVYNSRGESHSVPVLDDRTNRSYSYTVRYRWKKILQIERLLFRFLAKFRASKGSPTSILSCDCRNVLIKHAFIRSEMLACRSTAGPGSALRLNWREGNAGEISYHSHSNERRPPTAELIFGSTARHQNRLVWTPAGFFYFSFLFVFISIHLSIRLPKPAWDGVVLQFLLLDLSIHMLICVELQGRLFCPWDNSGLSLSLAFDVHGDATLSFQMSTFIPSLCYIMHMSTLITASWQKSGATETEENGRKRDATFFLLVSLFITAKFPPFTVGRWISVWKSQVTAALFHRILYTAPSNYFLSRSFHRPVYFTPCFSFLLFSFFPGEKFPVQRKDLPLHWHVPRPTSFLISFLKSYLM